MKRRADEVLVALGLAETIAAARALIMAGVVTANTARVDKPGASLAADAEIKVKGKGHPWVGRGGVKLDHGLTHFAIDVAGLTALDVGASTGGFIDVLLARGARHVYAVDVGTNQLAWKLRQDSRVTVLEQTDARDLSTAMILAPPQIVTCDASFIRLSDVLPAALELAISGARLMALVKPQFEIAPHLVSKGGIVTDPLPREQATAAAASWLEGIGWNVLGVTPSPIKGADGNVEFLIAARKVSAKA